MWVKKKKKKKEVGVLRRRLEFLLNGTEFLLAAPPQHFGQGRGKF